MPKLGAVHQPLLPPLVFPALGTCFLLLVFILHVLPILVNHLAHVLHPPSTCSIVLTFTTTATLTTIHPMVMKSNVEIFKPKAYDHHL